MDQQFLDLLHSTTHELISVYGDKKVAEHHAWWLLEKLFNRSQADLIVDSRITITDKHRTTLRDWLRQITEQHKPMQYILGSVPFLNVTIAVEPPVLIPRPETEYWCELLIEQLKKHKLPKQYTILDLCTGSGCIALALAKAFPQATIYATDISNAALDLARKNAVENNINNITFLHADLYKNLPSFTVDLIISNPPYVAPQEWVKLEPEVTQWEDKQALVAPDHGLAIIEQIVQHAPAFLKPARISLPQLWVEIGYHQGPAVTDLFQKAGFHDIKIIKDLADRDRVVVGSLSTQR